MEATDGLLQLRGVNKYFPGVQALKNVSLSFERGKVHALLGENGAGKSTMMNIIFGYCSLDDGEIFYDGDLIEANSPVIAQERGISMVHQEDSLVPYLSVMNNIYLGHYPKKMALIDEVALKNDTQNLLNQLDIVEVKPTEIVENLGAAQKQLIEIAKALSRRPKLLMMDEPTASLTEKEVSILKNIIQQLKKENVAVIYVSHRIEEVFEIADEVTILRDGEVVTNRKIDDITIDEAVKLMVGRDLSVQRSSVWESTRCLPGDEVVLKVENLSSQGKFWDVSFSLRKGEILGLSGLVGAGRTELLEAIFGCDGNKKGDIYVGEDKANINQTSDAIRFGMAMIPEDRKRQGLFSMLSVSENVNIVSYHKLKKYGFINKALEARAACQCVKMLDIRTPSINTLVSNLSGGNQQKAILARWLQTEPSILLLDEPTHGIDVGAKAEIYRIIRQLASEGMSIIIASSELPELINLCDELIVMHKGTIRAKFSAEEFSEEKIIPYQMGIK